MITLNAEALPGLATHCVEAMRYEGDLNKRGRWEAEQDIDEDFVWQSLEAAKQERRRRGGRRGFRFLPCVLFPLRLRLFPRIFFILI